MQILTDEKINQRTIELYNEIDEIIDHELKSAATEWANRKIECMRKAVSVLEDDDFIADALDQLDGDDDFMNKVVLLKQLFIP